MNRDESSGHNRRSTFPDPDPTIQPAKAFYVTGPDAPIDEMSRLVISMFRVLHGLHQERLPNSQDYSLEDLRAFVVSLVAGQRGQLDLAIRGSWCVAHDTSGMDGDARQEFIHRPTYIATAVLIRALYTYPNTLAEVRGLGDAIRHGLGFSACRNLRDHGYGELPSADTIMRMGKVPEILKVIACFSRGPRIGAKILDLMG
jgi:hypothetical protein